MAVASISVDLEDGQEIVTPHGVSGTATVTGTTISVMAWQIDTSTQQSLAFDPANAASVTFSFDITAADCPNLDTWYILSVYCWDSVGDLTIKSVTFKRVAEVNVDPDADEAPSTGL